MARAEELSVRAGEATLAGTLLLPETPPPADRNGRHPSVLLLPSWLPRDRDGALDRVRAHRGQHVARVVDAGEERHLLPLAVGSG
jgi:hypothetical protein